jgi:hypothetical protein
MDHLEPDLDHDALVVAVRSRADVLGKLEAAAEIVAVQAAVLRHMQLYPHLYDDLVESGRAVTRRIRAVMRYVALELRQQRHASSEQVDLHGPAVRQILNLLVGEIEAVTHDVLDLGVAEQVMTAFRTRAAADPTIPWP